MLITGKCTNSDLQVENEETTRRALSLTGKIDEENFKKLPGNWIFLIPETSIRIIPLRQNQHPSQKDKYLTVRIEVT
jgi:hypothetical protein